MDDPYRSSSRSDSDSRAPGPGGTRRGSRTGAAPLALVDDFAGTGTGRRARSACPRARRGSGEEARVQPPLTMAAASIRSGGEADIMACGYGDGRDPACRGGNWPRAGLTITLRLPERFTAGFPGWGRGSGDELASRSAGRRQLHGSAVRLRDPHRDGPAGAGTLVPVASANRIRAVEPLEHVGACFHRHSSPEANGHRALQAQGREARQDTARGVDARASASTAASSRT